MAWEENKHPRDEDGKFASKENSSEKNIDSKVREVVNKMTNNGTKEVNLNAGTIARASNGELSEEDVHKWFEENDELEDYEAFDDDYEEEFDNSQRADFIVENYGDLELTDDEFDQVEYILGSKEKAEELKNIVKNNLDLGDGEEQAIRNALENFKITQESEPIDFDNDPFLEELYGTTIDNIIKENYPIDEIGPDKKEQKQIKKEANQRKSKEKMLDETTKKVESLLSEGKGKEFLDVLNGLSEEDSFEVLKRIKIKK